MPRFLTFFLALMFLLSPPVAAQSESDIHLRLNSGGHTAKIGKLVVTSTGQIVTASYDKTVTIWDFDRDEQKLREVRQILTSIDEGWAGMNYTVAVSPDGKYLAKAGYQGVHDFSGGYH